MLYTSSGVASHDSAVDSDCMEDEPGIVVEAAVCVEPPAKKVRFGEKIMSDVATLIDQQVPTSTKKTTAGWSKVFMEYCSTTNWTVDLNKDGPKKMSKALALVYVNARMKDAKPYHWAILLRT